MKNNFINEFSLRGFFHQCTDKDKLTNLINEAPIKAYIGFDCTASSTHAHTRRHFCLQHCCNTIETYRRIIATLKQH